MDILGRLLCRIIHYQEILLNRGRTRGGGGDGGLTPANLHRQADTKVGKIEISTKQRLVGPKH